MDMKGVQGSDTIINPTINVSKLHNFSPPCQEMIILQKNIIHIRLDERQKFLNPQNIYPVQHRIYVAHVHNPWWMLRTQNISYVLICSIKMRID